MATEPQFQSVESIDIVVRLGNLVACLQSANETTTSLPLTQTWGDLLYVSSSCSMDEDVFYEGGEMDTIETQWFCYRSCEGRLLWDPMKGAAENASLVNRSESLCKYKSGDFLVGCFLDNVTENMRRELDLL
jgi:hypothetical protein